MKIETVLIPVKLLLIKVCFRFLTFDSVQDKYSCYAVRVAGYGLPGYWSLATGPWEQHTRERQLSTSNQ